MAVTLKLARHGVKGTPHYRIVAAEKGSKRDGRFIEIIGTYSPTYDPPKTALKEDKVRKWLSAGAQTTGVVRALIKKSIPGLMEDLEEKRLKKLQTARQKRKARIKARGKK